MPLRTERILAAVALLLAAGATSLRAADPAPAPAETQPVVGAPFDIDGTSYRPADAPLDEVGWAGFLAGGEGRGIVAAHRTLPLPSYVEVTDLGTGRTILVRVTERGPMVNDRIIDLSCAAARQLGVATGTAAAVRIRRVNPPPQERGTLAQGGQAAVRLDTPKPLLAVLKQKLPAAPRLAGPGVGGCGAPKPATEPAPIIADVKPLPLHTAAPAPKPAGHVANARPAPLPESTAQAAADPFVVEESGGWKSAPPRRRPVAGGPVATPAPSPASSGWAIQYGALSDPARARALARRAGAGVERVGGAYRVRSAPYGGRGQAEAALHKARARGFSDAWLVPMAAH